MVIKGNPSQTLSGDGWNCDHGVSGHYRLLQDPRNGPRRMRLTRPFRAIAKAGEKEPVRLPVGVDPEQLWAVPE